MRLRPRFRSRPSVGFGSLSAAASGELLFTPRVGALYGYALLWAVVAALALKLLINREIGRYSVCTGRALLDGFSELPGPRNWTLWLILVPQLAVGIATIAGLASAAASALVFVTPLGIEFWMIVTTLTAVGLVFWGRYQGVERLATIIALALGISGAIAAAWVTPNAGDLVGGLAPSIPNDIDFAEILPWLGFMSAGAAGLMWYSYWVRARGFGMAGIRKEAQRPRLDELSGEDVGRLRSWLRQMTLDTSIAIAGVFVVTVSFLILGTELLRPEGTIPEGADLANELATLFEGVWGSFGFWFLLMGIYVGFWDTVLTDQDGFARMYADGTRQILQRRGIRGRWANEDFLIRVALVLPLALLPIGLFLLIGEPVTLLKTAGIIDAVHIAIVTALVLWLNRRSLPGPSAPRRRSSG